MKYIIYHCYGGNHSSVVAAALHVGILPKDRFPSPQELLSCPYFDSFSSKNIGELHFMGKDEDNNFVFTMGCMKSGELVEKATGSILKLLNIKRDDIIMVNTLHLVNMPLKIGGYLSRKVGLVFPGRWLAIKGVLLSYYKIQELVEKTKIRLAKEKRGFTLKDLGLP